MIITPANEDLYEFAIELRQLADTMPGGREDPLVRLSERMAQAAGAHQRDIRRDKRNRGPVTDPLTRCGQSSMGGQGRDLGLRCGTTPDNVDGRPGILAAPSAPGTLPLVGAVGSGRDAPVRSSRDGLTGDETAASPPAAGRLSRGAETRP